MKNKDKKKNKQNLSAVKIGVFVITGGLLLSLIAVGIISYFLPNINFITVISGIGTFVTAILTGLYVYTTTQQINIANQQLAEMKNDRIMQEQPLVFSNCETFEVCVPKMYYSPPEKEYSFCSQYYYCIEIKNESSFPAIAVDVISEMMVKTDVGNIILNATAKRIKFLGSHQSEKISFLFLDEKNICVYDALRQIKTSELPRIKTTIVYKNLCGAYFKTENYSTVFPTEEMLEKLIHWHTTIMTAKVATKEAIIHLKTLNFNDPKRRELFAAMQDRFAENFEDDVKISIECYEEPLGFDFTSISKDKYDEMVSEHGYGRRVRGFSDCSVSK